MKKELKTRHVVLILLGFIMLWTLISDAWGYSYILFKDRKDDLGTYIYGYISRIIWVIPAIILIIKYSNKLKYEKKELFSKPKPSM